MIEEENEQETLSSMETTSSTELKSLAQRMGEGRLPVADAIRYAMLMAEALRKLHDAGKCHGSLTPSNILLTGAGIDLMPTPEGLSGTVTPYTAPETLQSR